MRALQNSASSTVPELGISRGIPLPRRHKRLIENARLRSKLTSNDSSQLQISNRERIGISRHTLSPCSSFDPQVPDLENLIANADASSIGILSDQRESKDLSYRSPLRHQRSQLLIANLELEFHLTTCKANHMRFSNRKLSAIFHSNSPVSLSSLPVTRHSFAPSGFGARESSLVTSLLIETLRLRFLVTPTNTLQYKILIETKTALFNALVLASVSRHSPPVTHHCFPCPPRSPQVCFPAPNAHRAHGHASRHHRPPHRFPPHTPLRKRHHRHQR